MTITETRPVQKPIFGQITLADMRGNELLTKAVMARVAEVCGLFKGRYSAEQIADGIVAGDFDVWGVMRLPATLEAVAVTCVADRAFHIIMLGPEGRDMFNFLPALAGVARQKQCTVVRLSGPSFWRKQLPEGWRMASVVYEKAL